MGGKALNKYGVNTERKNTEEFQRIGKSVRETLSFMFLRKYGVNLETAIVTCYHQKSDHGDLDLLIKMTPEIESKNIDLRTVIQLSYLPQVIHNNGGVYSFDYQNFQVDFIPIKEYKWETAKVYYSYDPLGNIMGKTFHKFGLSYGWDGLFYKFRNFNGRNSQNILLTTDAGRIFKLGGYNYGRYLKGFDELEEIFEFTIACKYFDTEIFQMENLKSIDKKRNRKRGSYHLFLKYLEKNSINIRYDFHKDKELYLSMVDEFFPENDLLGQLYELRMKDTEDKILSQKFNGDIVMSWLPNLMGKELGRVIGKFKESFENDEDYREFILNAGYDAIQERFMNTHND